ncbi:MAG TPA: hypothetical protein VNV82_19245 [Bryobacteraceae bacterium]|jgi:hypothetical protein|nr:hypothetical protein [Bryobacteraceae bacterium]
MKTQFLLITALIAASAALQAADSKSNPPSNADASFARLKTLVGEWEANTSSGKVHLSYELVSGDTALLERASSETMPSMVTLYYVDGGRLLLTHYCMIGNQPRMQAKALNPDTGELDFQFLDATNLPNPGAGHMHNAKLRIVDNSHVVSEWQFYENGQPKFKETAQYTRVR